MILLLGGARSGKSDFAEYLAGRLGRRVVYVATAEADDEEMQARAFAHRARRPADWITVEAPTDVAIALEPYMTDADVVLLDCLTLLASNILIAEETAEQTAEEATGQAEVRLNAELDALLAGCRRYGVALIIVSNEVGQGVVPAYPLGRRYRDLLGRANQRLAARADHVLFFVAGLPLDLKALAGETYRRLGMEPS